MRLRPALPALALALLAPTAALAQDAVTGVSLVTHATFHNVGILVAISGDNDNNSAAALEVDVDGAGFQPAHRLSRTASDRFVGSAFSLPDGKPYQVRVTLTDPDGVNAGVLTGSGTTRAFVVPESTGNTIHVSPTGNDTSGTGAESSPFATIARGLQAAAAGDTVLVHAGRYHEEVQVPQGGQQGAPITLRGAGDGPAIMDGADPALFDASAWSDDGAGLYSAASSGARYVAVDGTRLWRYESMADLQSLSLGTDGGFYSDGTRVHVKLPGGATLPGHEIQVSTLGRALWLAGTPYFVIRDLTIRCYGAEEYSEGIMIRDGSHDVWVVDSVFENVMPGIWVKNDVDDLTVTGNEFSDRGLAEFPWQSVKDQGGMESGAIALDDAYDGQGIVFYRNTVHDSFDGLHICGQNEMSHPNNADVIENHIYHVGDDGMETDGECSNVRIIGNRFEQSLTGVSLAPAAGGPSYVIRNLMVDLRNVAAGSEWMTRALKFNVGDPRPTGETFVYHNTAVTYEADQQAFGVTDDSIWTAVHMLNNIWAGTSNALYYSNTGDDPFFEDYDLLHGTGTGLVTYQGAHYDTVPSYFQGTGQCEHCVASDPGFTDGAAGDYSLTAGSAAVDKGEVIAGINDGFAGSGPDMGAYELGGENPAPPDGGVGGASGAGGGSGAGGTGGASGAGGSSTGGAAGGTAAAAASSSGSDSGCGCRTAGAGERDVAWLVLGLAALAGARVRRTRPPRG